MFFFYLFHYLLGFVIGDVWSDLQKNCLNAVLGVICYFLLYGYLADHAVGWFRRLKDWFWYLVAADVAVMGVIYRNYYGRSIINEIGDDAVERWEYDDDKHQYSLSDYQKGKEVFYQRMETLDQAKDTLKEIEERKEEFDQTTERVDELEQNIQELDAAIRYAPGGDLAKAAEEDFNQRMGELTK